MVGPSQDDAKELEELLAEGQIIFLALGVFRSCYRWLMGGAFIEGEAECDFTQLALLPLVLNNRENQLTSTQPLAPA